MLTARELETLKLIAEGRMNKEIAVLFRLSEQTVKNHVSAIFRKLGAHDRTQAVVYALRRGIIPLGYVDGGAGI